MEKLLQLAGKKADESEVFSIESQRCELSIVNGTLKDLEGNINSGYALRLIKKNLLGTSYINNPADREKAISGALASLVGKMKIGFGFPGPSSVANVEYYDPRVKKLTYSDLYGFAQGMVDQIGEDVKGQLNVYSGLSHEVRNIMNSNGLERTSRYSSVYFHIFMMYPKTTTGVSKVFIGRDLKKTPKKALRQHLDLYNATIPQVEVATGKYPVIFLPHALFPVMWRLSEGANGKNIYEKTSPLAKKLGRKVFSEDISVIDDPLDAASLNATAFDDEGVPTRRLEVFGNGVFKSPYVNLDYAKKLGMKPTGHGFRTEFFLPGNPIRMQPTPNLRNFNIQFGKDRFSDMVGSMKKGIIAASVIGPHSGNILNGDFSVGLNPGFYVEKGEIVGRVKSGLISGNIYELLNRVSGIEDRSHDPDDYDRNPSMMFDDVMVSAK